MTLQFTPTIVAEAEDALVYATFALELRRCGTCQAVSMWKAYRSNWPVNLFPHSWNQDEQGGLGASAPAAC